MSHMAHDTNVDSSPEAHQITSYIEMLQGNRDFLQFPLFLFLASSIAFIGGGVLWDADLLGGQRNAPEAAALIVLGIAWAIGFAILLPKHVARQRNADAQIAKAQLELTRLRGSSQTEA